MASGADAFAQLNYSARGRLLDYAAGNFVADFVLGDVLVDAGGDQLLHGELDLALYRVDGQNLGFDDLAGAEHILRMIDALVGADLADVDQAFNAIFELHEGAEVHELGDRALDLRACGELLLDVGPGVGEGLLEAEGDAPLLRLDGEDDCVDTVALLENVAGVAELFAVGHLRNMNEAFDARLDFDKCSKVGEAGDGAGDALAGDEAFRSLFPWLGLQLLEAERNLLGLRIDFENAYLQFLADSEHVFGLGDAAVRDVADVEEPIDAAEIDEGSVGHEGADGAGNGVAFLHCGVARCGLGAGLFFKHYAAIDDYIFVGDFELGDAAVDLRADQLF